MLCQILDNPYSSFVKVNKIGLCPRVANLVSIQCSENNKNINDCNI